NSSFVAVCLRIEAYSRASTFCPLARLGRSGEENSKRKPIILSLRSGKKKSPSNQKITMPTYAMFSCGIYHAISTDTTAFVFHSLVVWTRALSWLGARLNLIHYPVTRTGACTAITRTCNWHGV